MTNTMALEAKRKSLGFILTVLLFVVEGESGLYGRGVGKLLDDRSS